MVVSLLGLINLMCWVIILFVMLITGVYCVMILEKSLRDIKIILCNYILYTLFKSGNYLIC